MQLEHDDLEILIKEKDIKTTFILSRELESTVTTLILDRSANPYIKYPVGLQIVMKC